MDSYRNNSTSAPASWRSGADAREGPGWRSVSIAGLSAYNDSQIKRHRLGGRTLSDDKDMMMLRFKTAIDRELSRSEAPNAKKPRPEQVTAAPRTPPRTQPPGAAKPKSS